MGGVRLGRAVVPEEEGLGGPGACLEGTEALQFPNLTIAQATPQTLGQQGGARSRPHRMWGPGLGSCRLHGSVLAGALQERWARTGQPEERAGRAQGRGRGQRCRWGAPTCSVRPSGFKWHPDRCPHGCAVVHEDEGPPGSLPLSVVHGQRRQGRVPRAPEWPA